MDLVGGYFQPQEEEQLAPPPQPLQVAQEAPQVQPQQAPAQQLPPGLGEFLARGLTSGATSAAKGLGQVGQGLAGLSGAPAPVKAPEPTTPEAPAPTTRSTLERGVLSAGNEQAALTVKADKDEAAIEKAAADRKAVALEQHSADTARLTQERDVAVGAQRMKVREIADQARNTKIDEKQLYKESGFAGKLSMFAAVALGGLLIPTAGKNPGLEIINQKIARNIDAQKANLANLRDSVGEERSVLQDLRVQFGDDIAAEQAMHGMALDQLANEVQGKLAGVKDTRAQAQGMKFLGDIQAKALEFWSGAEERTAAAKQQEISNAHAKAQLALQGAELKERGRATDIADVNADADRDLRSREREIEVEVGRQKAAAEQAGKDKEDSLNRRTYDGVYGAHGPAGRGINIANAQDGENVASKVGGAQKVLDRIADVRALQEAEGRTSLLEKEKALGKSAMADIIQFISEDNKGVPSDADVQRALDRVGGSKDPTAWLKVLSPEEMSHVLGYVADKVSSNADVEVRSRTDAKGGFKYQGRSLLGEMVAKREAAPQVKIDAARKADEKRPFSPGERGGEFTKSASVKMKYYEEVAKTDNFTDAREVSKTRGALLADLAQLQARSLVEKDADKKADIEAAAKAATKALVTLTAKQEKMDKADAKAAARRGPEAYKGIGSGVR